MDGQINHFEILLENIIDNLDEDIFNSDISMIHPVSNIFSIGELKYEISIIPAKNVSGAVVGTFKLINNPVQPQYKDFGNDIKKYLKAKEDAEMGDVDVSGNGPKIIGIILTFYKKYIIENRPRIFIFHARNDKRAKSYTKIGKILANKTQYNFSEKKDPSTEITEFWLSRKDIILKEIFLYESAINDYPYIKNYL